MKKTLMTVLAVALILSIVTTGAFASCSKTGKRNTKSCHGGGYSHHSSICSHIDKDYNGVCDSCGRRCGTARTKLNCCFADADSNGLCDTCGKYYLTSGTWHGCSFADENCDGICDTCGTHHGAATTNPDCCFVDSDCDGVCDTCGTHHGTWTGSGDYTGDCHEEQGHGHRGSHCR